MSRPQAAILTVGDELLRGDVVDSNKAHIAASLGDHGFEVVHARTVLDRESAIVDAVQQLQGQVDLILMTGGLGPTVDDITARSVAKAFGQKLRRFPEAEAHLRELFGRLNRPIAACNFQQADLPEDCEILANPVGSAVGFALAWSREKGAAGRLMSLPGVPFEMRRMLANEVLPRCSRYFDLPQGGAPRRIYRSMGMGESTLAQRLGDRFEPGPWTKYIEARLGPEMAREIGPVQQHYRSHAPEVLLILEFPALSRWPAALGPILDELVAEPAGPSLYAVDAPELVQQCKEALEGKGLSLAVAESCTGGGLGELLTREAGASSFFIGGVLAYSNAMKERLLGVSSSLLAEHGAVSRACVQAMAQGVREKTGADIGVSISGIAGPTGGSEAKPVGTVFVGISTPDTQRVAHLLLRGDRSGVRRRAAQWACRMVVDALAGRQTWLGWQGRAFYEGDRLIEAVDG